MSIKKNIFVNYATQIYTTVIGIIMVPVYIKYMGVEAYGLVGFFTMLQVWFGLLDMGVTPTMSRETARFNGGATDALSYRRLLRAIEGIFFIVAIAGGGAIFFLSEFLAQNWIKPGSLAKSEIVFSLEIISIIVASRWMCGLYRGVISGAEKFVWISKFNSIIATLRYIGVWPVLAFIDRSPTTYFIYQLVVAIIELMGISIKCYKLLPKTPKDKQIKWDYKPLKKTLGFSLSIAFTSSVWVIVTQTDKLILSKILNLADYGYYTIAVLVASGITMLLGPVGSAIMPRMVSLESNGKHDQMILLYRKSTQLIVVISVATSTTLALGANLLLDAWTGNSILTKEVAPILSIYAWGNGVLGVASLPYFLQYAKGNLRFHLIGNALFLILYIPTIIFVASKYYAVGAGYVWLGINLITFSALLPLVHNKFMPGLNTKWFINDVFIIAIPIIISGMCLRGLFVFNGNRWFEAVELLLFEIILLAVGALGSSFFRYKFTKICFTRSFK